MTDVAVQKHWTGYVLAFVLGIALAVGWQLIHLAEASDNLPYVLGYNMPTIAIISVVIYVAFLRDSGWMIGLVFLVAMFAAVAATNYAIVAYERGQARQFTADIQRNFDSFRSGNSVESAAPARGEFGPLQDAIDKLLVESAADHKAYLAEITTSGVLGLVNPNVMADHPADAQSRLSRARAVIVKYRALANANTANARSAIANSDLAGNLKTQALQGFDESAPKAKAAADQIWGDESRIVDEIGAIDELLGRARGKWTVLRHKFIFSDVATLEAYNAHVAEMQRLGSEEQAISRHFNEENQARLNALKQLSK
jgi:hypothetical protein